MAVSKYFEMYKSFLRGLSDGVVHPYIDIENQVIKDFNLCVNKHYEHVGDLNGTGNQH